MKEALVPQRVEAKRLFDVAFVKLAIGAKREPETLRYPMVEVPMMPEPITLFEEVTLVAVALVVTRLVTVPLPETRVSINALVALRLVVVTPPKKVTATEVVAPRAVTIASVSVEYMETQFVPLARQTNSPETRRLVKEAEVPVSVVV